MDITKNTMFTDYATWWVDKYKANSLRQVTLNKYYAHINFIKKNALDLPVGELNRASFQKIINAFAFDRIEKSVRDFSLSFKAMLKDLVYEGILEKDPAHRIVIWGGSKEFSYKQKYLSLHEIQNLVQELNLKKGTQRHKRYLMDWLIYVGIKTGMRFSEILAVTEFDVDFENKTINVNKTWNYKKANSKGYLPTKSKTSIRKIPLDRTTMVLLKTYLKENKIKKGHPIFFDGKTIHNSTVNDRLEKLCRMAGVPIVSYHSLRHTYTSLNLAAGVSLQSVSKNLGHSDTVMTQRVYSHLVDELKEHDNEVSDKLLGGF